MHPRSLTNAYIIQPRNRKIAIVLQIAHKVKTLDSCTLLSKNSVACTCIHLLLSSCYKATRLWLKSSSHAWQWRKSQAFYRAASSSPHTITSRSSAVMQITSTSLRSEVIAPYRRIPELGSGVNYKHCIAHRPVLELCSDIQKISSASTPFIVPSLAVTNARYKVALGMAR